MTQKNLTNDVKKTSELNISIKGRKENKENQIPNFPPQKMAKMDDLMKIVKRQTFEMDEQKLGLTERRTTMSTKLGVGVVL